MARTGRPRAEVVLTDEERETLLRCSRRATSAQAFVLRCGSCSPALMPRHICGWSCGQPSGQPTGRGLLVLVPARDPYGAGRAAAGLRVSQAFAASTRPPTRSFA
ncbi:hypothetical protein SAMN06272775_5798 [Streptomyces sp. 2323.1]|nr:hypothetical protein SAMN06272775_5798 [Streptomyces sp. 2323.1]